MNVEFSEGVKIDVKELIGSLPSLFREINPPGISAFEHFIIRITDNEDYQCEMIFDSHIILSEKTIEIMWSLNYAHLFFYKNFCKGIQPVGQWLSLNGPEWSKIKPQLTWAVENLIGKKSNFNSSFDRSFFRNNEYGLVFSYSLAYFLSHEFFHFIHKDKHNSNLEEERQCDFSATKFIVNGLTDKNYLERSLGVALGLMVLNVYGIHSSNYDGKTHPFTYDRIIDNLSLVFGRDNDKVWGFVMALFALHCTQAGLDKPTGDYENFYDAMKAYKELIESKNTGNG